MDEPIPFFIGHHDSKRETPVTLETIQQARSANYDMVTSPITSPHFHSRVLSLLSSSSNELSNDTEITHSRNASPLIVSPLSPDDTPLTPNESTSHIIGITSRWIDLSSPDPVIADISQQVLKLELTYAAFCGINYVIIPCESSRHSSDVNRFARTILHGLTQCPYLNLYVWFDMTHGSTQNRDEIGDLASFTRRQFERYEEEQEQEQDAKESSSLFGTWETWNTIRNMCKYSPRLCVALSIPGQLPLGAVQLRWISEPVRFLTFRAETFSINVKGYPALSKAHQDLVVRFARLKPQPWILLCNADSISHTINNENFPSLAEAASIKFSPDSMPYVSYMRHFQTKTAPKTPVDRFCAGYQDFLQAPLQPLTVNLESITYEVFEKDPVKYAWYEKAIARALHDWIEQGKPTSNPDGRVVVAVVGAGRGPLVTRALQASEDVEVDIDLWALEKNPNAFVLLQRHNQSIWENRVNLVKSDMRTWGGPITTDNHAAVRQRFNVNDGDQYNEMDEETTDGSNVDAWNGNHELKTQYKIDILISELLGSFADNELSPECLDGVQHLLNPTHGISIPRSYTPFLTPIAAPKLHADISLNMINTTPEAPEIPYVVMLNAIDFLSTTQRQSPSNNTSSLSENLSLRTPTVTPVWSFQHPNMSLPKNENLSVGTSNAHNARYASLSFPVKYEGVCHGLAGYFEAVLYPGVELSTNPNTQDQKSEHMVSWFPIYFPLKVPVYVPSHSEVRVSMWRQTDDRRVWYEWMIEVYSLQPNPGGNGKVQKVGGSELHSSEKEACLM